MKYAPFWRCLLAIIYDSLVISALFFIFTSLYYLVIDVLWYHRQEVPVGYNPILTVLLIFIIGIYFLLYWKKTGQTLGMSAWRIRVQNRQGQLLTWKQCFIRFFGAFLSFGLLGLGFLWILIPSQHRTWHDLIANSEIIFLNKTAIKK